MSTPRPRGAHVFVVRTWTEEREDKARETRGMVRNVHSGETRYFRTWCELLKFVSASVITTSNLTGYEVEAEFDPTSDDVMNDAFGDGFGDGFGDASGDGFDATSGAGSGLSPDGPL